ncbi:MAG: hypothetical protein JXN61_00740 [Sedimentisphaerales bacterium]|nr:hypothetical protein [Sedimentisphaerales bacterium]
MHSQWTEDFAFEQLKRNERTIRGAENSNEATTRLRAIDTVLFDILGWDKLAVESERYCRIEGYADYAFVHDGDICLVLEAKRSGETFLLAKRVYADRPFGFGLLAKESPAALDAIQQASGYAASLGARYVAISNGHQWLLGLAFVPGQPIQQRLVYVFESYEAITNRFAWFWRCFSPQAIQLNIPTVDLVEARKTPPPTKLSARIPNYPAPADRNIIVNQLSYVLGLVWDEMLLDENDEGFLRNCYVRPQASEDTLAIARELLAQRLDTDELAASEVLDASSVSDLLLSSDHEKPIVVLGDIGHGKSIFLKYLRLIKAKEELKRYLQIDIDFLDRPDSKSEVSEYIYREINRQLLDRYDVDITEDGLVRGSLDSELQRLKRTPKGKLLETNADAYKFYELEQIDNLQRDHHEYLTRVIRHLKLGRACSLALFLDNLDRRDDPIQEQAFLNASAMARDWACLVFVCLRPATFYRSRREGVLDSLAPKTISVSSPKTSILLKKRFAYARAISEGHVERKDSPQRGALGRQVTLDLPSTSRFLHSCETSVKNKELMFLFDAVSNGNVRDLLRYTKEVLTSKHLNTRKIIEILGEYQIPVHEAQRALQYGDSIHYDPDRSPFVNVFDIEHADPTEHFTRFLVLQYLSRLSPTSPTRGFCLVNDVVQYLSQLGYSAQHATNTCRFLYIKRCCRGPVADIDWKDIRQIRATTLGRYHTSHLITTFQYFDAVAIDTPIVEDDARKLIVDVQGIERRLNRCQVFADYLDRCSNALQDAEAIRLWKDSYRDVVNDVRAIRSRVEFKRNRGEREDE